MIEIEVGFCTVHDKLQRFEIPSVTVSVAPRRPKAIQAALNEIPCPMCRLMLTEYIKSLEGCHRSDNSARNR